MFFSDPLLMWFGKGVRELTTPPATSSARSFTFKDGARAASMDSPLMCKNPQCETPVPEAVKVYKWVPVREISQSAVAAVGAICNRRLRSQ
ncbi:hypothetical protein DPMN_119829 [Dreissena polymorpha]|uniref:Uncharacterized protein n=1 Tax=Dreissena polymorpha TaxID=45954 RepID=A0A9D4GJG6_DREPO|nr:hypothetical protein DPMN_119829 [Dreissena polymorpha]